MSLAQAEQTQTAAPTKGVLDITVRTGSGTGSTLLSAFDHALQQAGVADFNLVTLSSVIPTGSRIRHVDAPLPGGHGDLLFCVRSEAFAEHPGDTAWAGLGWCVDETGGGLFVEHHGESEASVIEQIELSLADMNANRGGRYGQVQFALTSARCVDRPVCAIVLAAYRVSAWHEPSAEPPDQHGGSQNGTRGTNGTSGNNGTGPAASAPGHQPEPRQNHGHTVTGSPSSEPPLYDSSVITARAEPEVRNLGGSGPRVTVETEVDYVTARKYYELYREAFGELEITAAARQVMHESEFLAEMLDPHVQKYVAWDDEGQAIAMTTLTTDLETVPWISPAYYEHHYPELFARKAIYYFGFALVHPDHQGSQMLHTMIGAMSADVIGNRGMVCWDLCMFNEQRKWNGNSMALLEELADVTIETIDRQTYYTVVVNGPLQSTSG